MFARPLSLARPMTITLITGANKGIGFATAQQLTELGHTVYIGARNADRGRRAAAQIGARSVQLDVTDDASVAAALATIDAAEGRLDVLIHNAGILTTALDGPAALRSFDTNAAASSASRRRRCRSCAGRPTPTSSRSPAAWGPSGR